MASDCSATPQAAWVVSSAARRMLERVSVISIVDLAAWSIAVVTSLLEAACSSATAAMFWIESLALSIS
jgi:hypothetical protein